MNNDIKNINLSFKCQIDYHAMPDVEGGKFCDQCQKKVYDFTNTPADVFRQILTESDNKLCGRFTPQQMANEQLPIFKPLWKKWIAAALVLIGINLASRETFAQGSVKKDKPAKSSKITADPPVLGEITVPDTNKKATIQENAIFGGVTELPPEFPGGLRKFQNLIQANLQPVPGFEGTVMASFFIEKDGTLSDFKILKGTNKQANAEVVRVLKLSPKWRPCIQNAGPVRVQYTIPVQFK